MSSVTCHTPAAAFCLQGPYLQLTERRHCCLVVIQVKIPSTLHKGCQKSILKTGWETECRTAIHLSIMLLYYSICIDSARDASLAQFPFKAHNACRISPSPSDRSFWLRTKMALWAPISPTWMLLLLSASATLSVWRKDSFYYFLKLVSSWISTFRQQHRSPQDKSHVQNDFYTSSKHKIISLTVMLQNHTFKMILHQFETQNHVSLLCYRITHSKWFYTSSKRKSQNHESVSLLCYNNKNQPSIHQSMHNNTFGTYLYSVGTHHRNLLKSLVAVSRVTYLILMAHTENFVHQN